ncbi:MAG TPA: hypothetical protein VK553_00435 [Candidatus Nitrosopolaris rasttigaisensis]|nr:hypothetical protein [Candidatus Nitrosopolaris rasttigaisensis]
MEPSEELHSEPQESREDSENITERELEINGRTVHFVGQHIEGVKEEDGIIKVEPAEADSRFSIVRGDALPFEVGTTNDNLGLTNGEYSLGVEDSLEKGRIIRYKSEKETQETQEISVNKNGEYPIGEGKLKVEDNGRKVTLFLQKTKLQIEGFGEERRLRYLETSKDDDDDDDFMVDVKSQKEVNAARRAEILGEFQRHADEINGDRHGLAKGVTRILNDNDVKIPTGRSIRSDGQRKK